MSRYLITFDMDTNCLKSNYHSNNYNNAYADIQRILGIFIINQNTQHTA